jgi:hypothetical protein
MWLDLLCMGMYIPAFRRNEVTGQYLTQIDKHDLRSMGMKSIGTLTPARVAAAVMWRAT